ncbi:neutral/alkaline ceramidase [Aeromicrobium sp. CTD01-1L150]|uniref:neutral/alkaline ceramidase n=1 Tax=Aeromicrobium sp. CTD01-1L150 TaxID=3341830 RepID=UPI0035C01958
MDRRSSRGAGPRAIVLLAALLVALPGVVTGPSSASPDDASGEFLVGRGVADVTGRAAENPMLGYADLGQETSGIHMRQRSRAFVIAEPGPGERVVHVVADVAMIFQSVRDAVLARLQERFGDRYGERNVMLTATHTHAGPGGTSHHHLYNLTTMGLHRETLEATVDGIVESVVRADADLAPADVRVSEGTLEDANVNRSREAFDRNPPEDRRHFPDGKDTRTTTLQVVRDGRLDGVINFFPVHATSMSTDNTLISPDNKGYAQYDWEHHDHGVDHLADADPEFVASFAQTNAGDMSPNLNLRPTDGPTTDEFENTRIIGERQKQAAQRSLEGDVRSLQGGVDSRITHVDMSDVDVRPEFTPDGTPQRTCEAALGAAFAGGSTEDGGGGLPVFSEKDGLLNPAVRLVNKALYTASPSLRECQAPKDILLPVGSLDLVQQRLPLQLVRVGDLYLLGVPAEVTVVSGLRLRQTVAERLDVDLDQVVVQGYANAYAHYLTTPEEYDARQYEGASTLFGRYQLPATMQVAADLAEAMDSGAEMPLGTKERDRSHEQVPSPRGAVVTDAPVLLKSYGDVVEDLPESAERGERVAVTFVGAHPNNNLRQRGTYLSVERRSGDSWERVADDGDWQTRFEWERRGVAASHVRVTWDVPEEAEPGDYRIRYHGDARNLLGQVKPIGGSSRVMQVTR